MVTTRQKQGAGVAAAALLLLGSVYAWQSANQHKTNELRDTFKDNDVTLVEDFVPITNWLQGQEINKDISVKNNTSAETGNNAYVRIQLKEFLEFTDKTEQRSDVRYAVTTEGNFAKFDTQEAAQAYANANNLTGSPVQITETAFEGENYWFIPTNAEATHGQYGKFLVLKVGDGTSKSIIDPDVSKATGIDHQALTHAEDSYTTQLFNNGDDKLRKYPSLVKNTPTGGGIDSAKDLKDYISWTFGGNITTVEDFDADADTATTAQWVIDTDTGWVYWSQALAPGQTTGQFLDSLTLTLAPKNVSLYYAIHTDLEAVDYNDIDTMAPPTEIGTAWKNQKFTVTFESNDGSEVAPVSVSRDSLITKPENPTKSGQDFVGWYAKDDLTGSAWDFATDKMPAANLTLYAKWEVTPVRVHFRNYDNTADVLPAAKITADNPNLAIPDAPKANHYFLGWAEEANAAKTTTLYVPSTYTDVRSSLNGPDQTYLGYAVKPEHTIQNITTDTTLYAVYYKAKDAVTTDGDEFIWANAIWRNLKTDMDTNVAGKQALVIKANALTEDEATGSGATTGYYNTKFLATQTTYFSSTGENGYEASDNNVRKANAYYYANSLSAEDKTSVNKVALNNPSYDDFKFGQSFSASAYNGWSWSDWYKDTRFKTTLDEGGSKQAFALSYGDINTTMGKFSLDFTTDLNFTGSNVNYFRLRSAGYCYNNAGDVYAGRFGNYSDVDYTLPVRPALSIQIQ